MPSFISKNGEWFPADEKTVITVAGEPQVYAGKDRAAVEVIAKENGITPEEAIEQEAKIGMPAADDPQIQELARQRGMTVEQWMEKNKPTERQIKAQAEAQGKVVTHKQVKTKKSVVETKGGFGGDKDFDPVKEFDKKS
jgi:hypothetical protein